MRNIIIFLFVLCLLTRTLAGVEVGPRVRLASWNLHNLFDEVDDPYKDKTYSHDKVEKKLDQLAGVLNALEADIIAVQEVENRALLSRLASRIPGVRYSILVTGNDDFRGIQVGLLSKQPVGGYRTHRDQALADHGRFSRDCLEVHIQGTLPMVVLVNHFKSKLRGNEKSDRLRHNQAQGVVDIMTELERWRPGLPIAVMGDLNDGPRTWCLQPLSKLFDPFAMQPLQQRFTYRFKSKLTILDHILLNRALSYHYLPHGAGVWHRKEAEKASDHYPIYVDLVP